MSPPASVLSKTLQSITLTKIRELEKQRSKYENSKDAVLKEADGKKAKRDVIAHLLAGVKELYPNAPDDVTIKNIERWLHQSRYDASISETMLDSFEEDLRTKLEFQSRKLGLADLYSRLLTEWMSPPAVKKESEESDSEDAFEVVERQKERLQELCDKFESVVFEPLETDEVEIDNYMQGLFSDDKSIKALEQLRKEMVRYGDDLLANKSPFDEFTLTWCIKGLLAEDLLSDEKQKIIQDLLNNDLVLVEIADVLNMRFADISNWNWEAGEEGIPVLPRQQLNGKYRIWMDEDVLQAIFIHYVGIKWCVGLKDSLTTLVRGKTVWTGESGSTIPHDEIDKRIYFIGNHANGSSGVAGQRRDDYIDKFFLSQLPATIHTLNGASYDNDNGDKSDDGEPRQSSIKQHLLRKLAAEVLLHQTLNGEVAVIQSDLQWYATGFSHSTIYAIMRFVGFSNDWIVFFKKFLEAPLNMNPSNEASSSTPRLRKRGVPMAHAPEKLIGELVLFVMDLVVNKEAGTTLYRLHDDLWLCGEPERCARGWEAMGEFAKIAGLEFNLNKTGSVYLTQGDKKKDKALASIFPEGPVCVGFLILDPTTGEWTIDQAQVIKHVKQLKSQLEGCDSILSWVQTWNSCIGRFFSHTFGEPAFCFGKKHVDSILETHSRIERSIFGQHSDGRPKNVVQHLKDMITSRFGDIYIPDAFFYLPEQLGGLNLRNPFIPLLLVRDNIFIEPKERMAQFLAQEKAAYLSAKNDFDLEGKASRRRRFRRTYPEDSESPQPASFDPEMFFSWEEYTKYRLVTSEPLREVYQKLTVVPDEREIEITSEIRRDLLGLSYTMKLSAEEKWIVAMYKKELEAGVGGLRLVEPGFLPLGVLTMMRKKKVTWQMVL